MQPRSPRQSRRGAEVRPSGCATRALHADCSSRSWTQATLRPTKAVIPGRIFNKKNPPHTIARVRDHFSGARRVAMDTQVPQQQEKKTVSNARARVRHHRLFDRGPAVPRCHTRLCPVPGRSSQSACSEGGTRLLSRRHPYLQGAKQGTRARPRRRTPRCRLAPPPLNLPHKKRGSSPSRATHQRRRGARQGCACGGARPLSSESLGSPRRLGCSRTLESLAVLPASRSRFPMLSLFHKLHLPTGPTGPVFAGPAVKS